MKITPYHWIAFAIIGVIAITFFVGSFPSTEKAKEVAALAITPQEKTTPATNASPQAALNTSSSVTSTTKVNDYVHPALQERLSAMQKRRPNTQFDTAKVEATVHRENLWTNATQPAKNLPLKPEEFADGRQFINFDTLKIETLMPGDSLKIAIDEYKQNYEVIIDRIEQHDYENISWHGHIDGSDGQTYSVNFTRNENLTVAGLDTPEGNYVLQAHGNDGWIASSGLLFKVNPDESDVMYPTEEESTL